MNLVTLIVEIRARALPHANRAPVVRQNTLAALTAIAKTDPVKPLKRSQR